MKLIEPIEDDALNVRWWQHVNPHGVHITKVQCRETGRTVKSTRFSVGGMMRKPAVPPPAQLPPKGTSATG